MYECEKEVSSLEVSSCGLILDFRILSMRIIDADSNLQLFTWTNFDSNEGLDVEVNSDCEDEVEVKKLDSGFKDEGRGSSESEKVAGLEG